MREAYIVSPERAAGGRARVSCADWELPPTAPPGGTTHVKERDPCRAGPTEPQKVLEREPIYTKAPPSNTWRKFSSEKALEQRGSEFPTDAEVFLTPNGRGAPPAALLIQVPKVEIVPRGALTN